MGETVELTDVVLRIIGAFYAFGGFVATRAGLMSQIIDQAIAAIALKKPTRTETAQNAWLIATAALVLVGGVLLLAGLQFAAWVFVASPPRAGGLHLLRGAALISIARTNPTASGRRPDTNAFVIYTAATAFILWAAVSRTARRRSTRSRHRRSSPSAPRCCSMPATSRAPLWWSPRKSSGSGRRFARCHARR